MEEWRWINNYEGRYEVSNLGRVRSWCPPHNSRKERRDEPLLLKPQKVGNYLVVSLGRNNQHYVHVLVAEAFIGERPGHWTETQCCHGNGNTHDNAVGNLRWDTPAGNSADKFLHGTDTRGENNHAAKLTKSQVRQIRERLEKSGRGEQSKLAAEFGVGQTTISKIKNGYIWRE